MTPRAGKSSNNGLVGWLDSLARSMSSTMLYTTQQGQVDAGLELVHLSMSGIPAAVSSPRAIAESACTASHASRKYPLSGLALGNSASAADDGSHGLWDASDASLGPFGGVGLDAVQLAAANKHTRTAPVSSAVRNQPGQNPQAMQQQQLEQQHTPAASPQHMQQEPIQHNVCWLPGLKPGAGDGTADFTWHAQDASGADKFAATENYVVNGSSCNGPGAAAGTTASTPAAAGACQHPLIADAACKRSVQLPPSGCHQLDKYLRYLLGEAHPHSYMYYPSWGLTTQGCAAVGEFLRHDRRIKVMTLADNSIRDEGCELIAEGIAANMMLTSLDLSDNQISDMGAIALAEALHSNTTLKELRLDNNRVGDEGAEALAAVFASNSVLKKLHMSGNPLSTAQKQVVEQVVKTRVYRMPSRQITNKQHCQQSDNNIRSKYQIELTDSGGVLQSSSRHKLPSATAIAALSEPVDTLECSLAMQVAHLTAELRAATYHPARHSGSHDGSPSNLAAASSVVLPAIASTSAADISIVNTRFVPLLALRLAWRGYKVMIRTTMPRSTVDTLEALVAGCDGTAAGLKHTFVQLVQPGMAADLSPAVIVDPSFKEQFDIAHTNDRYRGVLDALPEVLVLAESRLYHLVEALCSEMALAHQDSGLLRHSLTHVDVFIERWLSKTAVDLAVDSDATLESLMSAMVTSSVQRTPSYGHA